MRIKFIKRVFYGNNILLLIVIVLVLLLLLIKFSFTTNALNYKAGIVAYFYI